MQESKPPRSICRRIDYLISSGIGGAWIQSRRYGYRPASIQDGTTRPVYRSDNGRQFVLDGDGELSTVPGCVRWVQRPVATHGLLRSWRSALPTEPIGSLCPGRNR